MAYAALVSLAQLLEQIMHHFFYIPLIDEEQILKSLHEKESFLQAFLDNYSHKGGAAVRSLEARIRDAAYQAEDVIEYHISDQIRSDYESCGVKSCFRQLVSAIGKERPPTIVSKYEEDLVKALELIDFIVEEATNIQISCRVEEMQISTHTSTLPSSSSSRVNGENKMVGFHEVLIKIKERLCGESSKLEIISIVGMGGIGKTTLARNIFDDSLIANRFHTRAWATVSQDYHLRGILLGVLRSSSLKSDDLTEFVRKSYLPETTIEELAEYVYKSLKGRTYLIVLDDMWSPEAWDYLRRIFPDDNNGSRIVIATRLTDVAEYASSSYIHRMHFLNKEESWNLLREKVFVEQSCPTELEEIGMTIAKNCGGLPLAIAVVAGILTKADRNQYLWKNIAKNINFAMITTDKHLSKILALSYDHLPHHLKACFLYMGGFPEDYKIPVSKLIKLWVAEGFLKPIGCKSFEEVAEEYLEDLVKRNLVLITKKRSNGKFRFCSMHDLLRDLCIRKAQEENFLRVVDRYGYTSLGEVTNHRRLTFCSNLCFGLINANTSALLIRSVSSYINLNCDFVLGFRLLRVLDAQETYLYSFPVEITELFHLRYLAFAFYNSTQKLLVLPPTLSKLRNLQTLIIHFSLHTLPFKLLKIPQLRHLILTRSTHLEIPLLENLQTLSGVVDFKLTSKVLDMIPNLKKLKVYYPGASEAKCSMLCLNNFIHLHQLETLNLDFSEDISLLDPTYPASYALPPNLTKLTLKGCRPPSDDMSIIGSLPNLQVLKLINFAFAEGYWESKEGEFQRLKFLLIQNSDLLRWRSESTHFPCLQQLLITGCWILEEIPLAIGDIPTLELIKVDRNSESAVDSAVLIQEEQQSLGNDILQVDILTSGATPVNGGAAPSKEPQHQNNRPVGGAAWVDLMVEEMMNSTSVDDAKSRAARVLENLEKSVSAQASAKVSEGYQKENMMLKEQIEALLRDNAVLKGVQRLFNMRSKGV